MNAKMRTREIDRHPALTGDRRVGARALFAVILVAALAVVGCSGQPSTGNPPRPVESDASADAGADAPEGDGCAGAQCTARCGAETCPTGCCDAHGTCQTGTVNTACGSGGLACRDCTLSELDGGALGGGTCTDGQCASSAVCTCTSGCCDGHGACQPGASNSACGSPGQACEDCTAAGGQCFGQRCVQGMDAGVCNAQTCAGGCCQSGICEQGITGVACGGSGTNCQNCLVLDRVCSNQECVDDPSEPPSCGPANCNCGCCDDKGVCLGGLDAQQCGTGGRRCVDCTTSGDSCVVGVCTTADGGEPCSQTCAGCCEPDGGCEPGFTDTQCGQIGSACLDCTSLSPESTCDVNVVPRTCVSLQTQCPGVYPSCPAALQQPAPVRQTVCSPIDIQNAAAGCAGGPDTAGCNAFFNLEATSNPACFACLQQFSYDFADGTGIRLCIEPFVDAACNHNSACVLECVREACYNCPDTPSAVLCAAQVQPGACAQYYQADECVTSALSDAGAVCNPATYQQRYEDWFQAVGGTYCGP